MARVTDYPEIDNVAKDDTLLVIHSGATKRTQCGHLWYMESIAKAADATLTDDECKGSVVYVGAPCTLTLPTPVAGLNFMVYVDGAHTVHIKPSSGKRIKLDGAALTADHKVSSPGVAGALIMLHADSTDGWTDLGQRNVWSDGGV